MFIVTYFPIFCFYKQSCFNQYRNELQYILANWHNAVIKKDKWLEFYQMTWWDLHIANESKKQNAIKWVWLCLKRKTTTKKFFYTCLTSMCIYRYVHTHTYIHYLYISKYTSMEQKRREKVIKSWGEGWVCVWNTGQEDKCIYAINKCIHLCNKIIKVPTIRNGFNYQMVSLWKIPHSQAEQWRSPLSALLTDPWRKIQPRKIH